MAVINLAQVASPSAPATSTNNIFIDTSGNLNIQKPDGNILELAAAGTYTLTIPATGTAALKDVAQEFTAAQTFSGEITAPGMKPASNSTTALQLTNVAGTAVLTVDTTNSKVITAGDVVPQADTSGLANRFVTLGYIVTDHFTSFSGWTWASDTHDGTPSSVSVASYPSWLAVGHNNISTNHFAYKAISTETDLYARLWVNADSYGGVRFDDGTVNNSIEIRIEQTATPGLKNLVTHHTVGGSLTSSTLLSNINGLSPLLLVLIKTSTVYAVGLQNHAPAHTRLTGSVASTWTPTRYGLIFGQRGATTTDYRRFLFVDWVRAV